jgi:hypothetical protein
MRAGAGPALVAECHAVPDRTSRLPAEQARPNVLPCCHATCRSPAAARLTQDASSGAADWAVVDNADPAAPGQLITAAQHRFGRLDLLRVLNRGAAGTG